MYTEVLLFLIPTLNRYLPEAWLFKNTLYFIGFFKLLQTSFQVYGFSVKGKVLDSSVSIFLFLQ